MECSVKKEVIVEGCTKEQAESEPWEYSVSAEDLETVDWEVLSVKENV